MRSEELWSSVAEPEGHLQMRVNIVLINRDPPSSQSSSTFLGQKKLGTVVNNCLLKELNQLLWYLFAWGL